MATSRTTHTTPLVRMLLAAALLGTLVPGCAGAASPPSAARPVPAGTLVSVEIASRALGHAVQASIYLPPGYPKRGVSYPVLFLLHGLPGSGPEMVRDLDLVSVADGLIASGRIKPLVIVAPSDGPTTDTDTEWINSPVISTWRWGTFVDRELPTWIDARYSVCTLRSGQALGGISMGGFGAMVDALRALPTFGAVTLWSPYFISNTPLVDGPTGSATWRADSPLYQLPADLTELGRYPLHISFYVGSRDGFAAQDVEFSRLLAREKIPAQFSVVAGGHGYSMWRQYLSDQLHWLSSVEHC